MINIYRDPVWELMDFFDPFERKLENRGLKNIKRPHDLINIKDENGKIIAQELRIVTTPFDKSDVKVKVYDNTLSVMCGSENKKSEENEDYVFKGISSQSYSFALNLAPSVDKTKITAENKDGILKINLPLIIEEEKKPEEIEIKIS